MYPTRDEATAAFSQAMAQVAPHSVLPEDQDGAKVLIGLRSCRKHYLARSSNVPQDIPCEACTAASLARPSLVMPAPYADKETEVLQQFIWHGKDYLEKLWTDTTFLNDNFLLKNVFPSLTVDYNPLMLPVDEYVSVLEKTHHAKGDGLMFLRGRMEQVRDAKAAGTFTRKSYHGYELKALPYSNTWTGDANVEKTRLALEKSLERQKKSYVDGHITDDAVIQDITVRMNAVLEAENALEISMGRKPRYDKVKSAKDLFTPWSEMSPKKGIRPGALGRSFPPPTLPASITLHSAFTRVFGKTVDTGFPFAGTLTGGAGTIGASASSLGSSASPDLGSSSAGTGEVSINVDTVMASTGSAPLSPTANSSNIQSTSGASMCDTFEATHTGAGPGTDTFAADTLTGKGSSNGKNHSHSRYTVQGWLEEDPLDFVSKGRLERAFFILGQSTTLTKRDLPQAVLTQEMKKTILESKGLNRAAVVADNSASIGADGVNLTKTKGSIQGQQVEQGDDHLKTEDTEVSYYYRGAQFRMPQMRVPNQGRIEDVWVNYDAPEWQGIAKGRAIRSFEFNEANLKEGKEKNEYRKKVQGMLQHCLEQDVVATPVQRILELLKESEKIGGSVLKLDCIQAETFLKWRKALIKSIRKMQAMARGNTGRRAFRRVKLAALRLKRRIAMTRAQSILLSRQVVPLWLQQGRKQAGKHLNSVKFTYSLNMSGEQTVVRITLAPRHGCKDGNNLCPTCIVRASRKGARNKVNVTNRAPLDFIQNDVISYSAGEGVHVERGMCTCQWIQAPEQWQLAVFEPLQQRTIYRVLSMTEVKGFIESIVTSQRLMDLEYRLKALVGTSFAPIAPLFVPTGIAFDGRLDMSYTMARLKASQESSILPLLPKCPGIWMTSDLLHAIGRRTHLPIDRLKSSGYVASRGMQVLNGFESGMELATVEAEVYEPLTDLLYGQRHADRVRHHEQILRGRIRAGKKALWRAEKTYEAFVTTKLEVYPMCYEDARSKFLRTDEALTLASDRIEAGALMGVSILPTMVYAMLVCVPPSPSPSPSLSPVLLRPN